MNGQKAGPSRLRPLEPLILSSTSGSNKRDVEHRRRKTTFSISNEKKANTEGRTALQPLRIRSSFPSESSDTIRTKIDKGDTLSSTKKKYTRTDERHFGKTFPQPHSSSYGKKALEPIQVVKTNHDKYNSGWKKVKSSLISLNEEENGWGKRKVMIPLRPTQNDSQPEVQIKSTAVEKAKRTEPIETTFENRRNKNDTDVALTGREALIPLIQAPTKKDDPSNFCEEKLKALEPLLLAPLRQDHINADGTNKCMKNSGAFAKLDHPKHAIHVLCNDVRFMTACTSQSGASIGTFTHLKRQTAFVHLVGRIVGIEEKDHKVRWLIDDGSGVVAVHHSYDPRPPVHHPIDEFKVDKGKQRAIDENIGIPAEYIRPKTPPPKIKRTTKTEAIVHATLSHKKFEDTYKHLSIRSLASVVGRVGSLFTGEMIVMVDRIVPMGKTKDAKEVRSSREGYIELLFDPNDEIHHTNQALDLASTQYMEEEQDEIHLGMDGHITDRREGDRSVIEKASKEACSSKRRLTYFNTEENFSQTENDLRVQSNDALESRLSPTIHRPPNEKQENQSNHKSIPTRRLRDFRKLSDEQVNADLLRIYVQKHISDHCRSRLEETKAGLVEIVDETPPAFTIRYLQRITDLRLLAIRVVEVALKKREAKRRKVEGEKASKLSSSISYTQSSDTGKVERLFESVICHIVADGMIVLNDTNLNKPYPPFDGQKPKDVKVMEYYDRKGFLEWEDKKKLQEEPIVLCGDFVTAKQMHLTADSSRMIWQGKSNLNKDNNRSRDSYQLITPEFLMQPIANVLGIKIHTNPIVERSQAGEIQSILDLISTQKIKERLQILDDRWRFLREESVADSIGYMREKIQFFSI